MSNLKGLELTKSERIIVVALSYLFCAPLIYANGKRLLAYFGRAADDDGPAARNGEREQELREQLRRLQEQRDLLRQHMQRHDELLRPEAAP